VLFIDRPKLADRKEDDQLRKATVAVHRLQLTSYHSVSVPVTRYKAPR